MFWTWPQPQKKAQRAQNKVKKMDPNRAELKKNRAVFSKPKFIIYIGWSQQSFWAYPPTQKLPEEPKTGKKPSQMGPD